MSKRTKIILAVIAILVADAVLTYLMVAAIWAGFWIWG